MLVVFACLCFFSAACSSLAEDRAACSSLLDGTCEEGLELLQATARKLSPPDSGSELEEVQGKDKEDLPAGWASAADPETHKTYYYKIGSKKSQWEKPVEETAEESGDRSDDSADDYAEDQSDSASMHDIAEEKAEDKAQDTVDVAPKKKKTEDKAEAAHKKGSSVKVKPDGDDTWDMQMKQQDKLEQKKLDAKELDIDFEKDELKEKEFNRIRFRARHQDWIDILDLYSDGFMQRYHDHDVGVWSVKNNQLVLKWLRWGEDALASTDDGISFNATVKGKKSLKLKSYWQPPWWKNWFKLEDKHMKDAQLKDQEFNDEASVVDIPKVIGDHINGKNADLSEQGYAAIATQKSNKEMETFVRRVAEKMNLAIINEGGLEGMVPYYSGVASTQSFGQMVVEMKKNSQSSPRWLWDRSA